MARGKTRSTRKKKHRDRYLAVRSVRRDPPDIRKLSKALIAFAMAEADREAQTEQQAREATAGNGTSGEPEGGGASNAEQR